MNAARGAHRDPYPVYTFASPTNDGLASFNINNAPAYLFSTIKDIQSVNSGVKVHLLPWSPVSVKFPQSKSCILTPKIQPSWMKTSNSINGGQFIDSFTNTC